MNKKLTRANYEAIRDHIIERIHRTGEEVKNDLPNILRTAINTETWKQFSDMEGKPFKSVVDWLHYTFPNGAMMGMGQHAISYQDALQLCAGAPDVLRVLLKNAPINEPGRPSKKLLVDKQFLKSGNNRSSSTTILSVRLAREKPKYYDAYMQGKYKSVTAAAIAAGLIKNDAHIRRTKSGYRKMSKDERKEFLKWAKALKD